MWRSQRKGLEKLFEDLLREYDPGLRRLAASYESLAHAREDLLQDIRLALWTALPRFRGECSMRTFVYRIAHNRSLSHI
jgi:RNA polymerase sigma factor (sigma-70 family)